MQIIEIVSPALSYSSKLKSIKDADGQDSEPKHWEKQVKLDHDPDFSAFDEFEEMSVQFGYMTLFAVALPLAPAFALVNNLFEIRVDAKNLCTYRRRLIYNEKEDIGSWMAVFQTYSALSVVTNAMLICFSSTAVAAPLVAAGAEPLDLYKNIGERYQSYDLWVVFIVIEHAIFLFKFLVDVAIDDEPEHTVVARERNQFTYQRCLASPSTP